MGEREGKGDGRGDGGEGWIQIQIQKFIYHSISVQRWAFKNIRCMLSK